MTEKLWDAIQDESVQYACSPQVLLQTIIRGSNHVRCQVCWQEAEPKYPELLAIAYEESDITPIYIRAIQGHSGPKKVKLHRMGNWEVCENMPSSYGTLDGATTWTPSSATAFLQEVPTKSQAADNIATSASEILVKLVGDRSMKTTMSYQE